MNKETNVQNLHITKFQIISKSMRAAKVISWSLFLTSVIAVAIMMSHIGIDQEPNEGTNRILTLLITCPLCALSMMKIYIHASVVVQVILGKYAIVEAKVLSIKMANRFANVGGPLDRMMEFSNDMSIIVDHWLIDKIPIGDTAVMVFVNNNKHPIIIENAKSFAANS
jgi:hypothetical protein